MQTQTLLLITDISGFTQFVARSKPETGIARAQEMLQLIVDSNDLGLELCEIEGDAVFFYLRTGLPTYERLLSQIRRTFSAFHEYLDSHDLVDALGIKFFVHVGRCESITVGGRTKLFGLDVITIHRLLKGVSASKNYMLMTQDAAAILNYRGSASTTGYIELEHIGRIKYLIFNEQVLRDVPVMPEKQETIWDQIATGIQVISDELALSNPRSVWRAFHFPLL